METNSKKEESLPIPPLQDNPHYSPQPPARVYTLWVSGRPLAAFPLLSTLQTFLHALCS